MIENKMDSKILLDTLLASMAVYQENPIEYLKGR